MTQHEIQRLLPRHFQILDLCLAGNGPKEIAQALDMSAQAVSLITHAPIFQDELSRRRSAINKTTDEQLANVPIRAKAALEAASFDAANVHIDLIKTAMDPKVRQASANAILDRVFGDEKKSSHQSVVVLEAGAIQNLFLALKESDDHQEQKRLQRQEREDRAEPGRAIQVESPSIEAATTG